MVAKIRKLFKEVLTGVGYEKVILFGSRARGLARRDSDYDLLLIMPRMLAMGKKISLSSELRRKFARQGIDADIIIKSHKEINRFKDKTGSVVKNALSEGIPL